VNTSYSIDLIHRFVNKTIETGFDEVAVLLYNNRETMIKIANSQPSVAQNWSEISIGIYLVKNKRIFILELKPVSIDLLLKPVEELVKYADKVEESMLYAPLPEPRTVSKLKDLVSNKVLNYIDNPYELVELSIESAHREKIDYIAGTIDLWFVNKILVTSKGVELSEDKTGYEIYIRAFKEPDGSGQWCTCGIDIDKKSVEETSLYASRYAVESINRTSIEPGKYDVILSPLVFGNLLEYVSRMTSALSIFMGMSMFMNNNPGDKVGSEKLTVHDMPRINELPNATSFDDEGIPTFNKPLIEKGVWKTILHNTKTAHNFGGETTGNAGWIYPHPWNIVVEPGDYSLDELISNVRKGVFITNNWYTRLQNYVEGLFSTISRDALFLIENGEVKKPVEKIRIADKLSNIIKNIDGLTKDTYRIMWWEVRIPSKLPFVLIRDVNITKHML